LLKKRGIRAGSQYLSKKEVRIRFVIGSEIMQ